MNQDRIRNICTLLAEEKAQAAADRDLFLVRQLGTLAQNLELLIRRDKQKSGTS